MTMEGLIAMLSSRCRIRAEARMDDLIEVRLRRGRPTQLRFVDGEFMDDEALTRERFEQMMSAMMDYSRYAREDEIARGFFTMDDGCRVGVCGRMTAEGRLADIGSACVRRAREWPGCADGVMPAITGDGRVRSTLIISPPGMGKTTLLRDIARQLSDGGWRVGLVDERHELAACRGGEPTLDVGTRTDVLDGCDRKSGLAMLIRSMAPQVVVADEIGGPEDAQALAEAVRCGVAVIAAAHADGSEGLSHRRGMRGMLRSGTFEIIVRLGGAPGNVLGIERAGGHAEARA